MKRLLLVFSTLLCSVLFILPINTKAADSAITDWYIKDFQSDIVLNSDSSLLITEKITADCGNLPDKHGIFRVLPLAYQKTGNEKVDTPIDLISITDFQNNPIKYITSRDRFSNIGTSTWKIGDPNTTVSGVNYYKITYKVQNAIRFDNNSFDEFYWNLSGNFWDLNINNFQATIHLPDKINELNSKSSLYSGAYGKNNETATLTWPNPSTVVVKNDSNLNPGEGVTLSLSFPKNIVTPYKPGFLERYGVNLTYFLPILIFAFCLNLWRKFGQDPKTNSAIVPEFEIPEKLNPLSMGLVQTNGSMKNQFLSAEIIYLATLGVIRIEQIKEKKLLTEADYIFQLVPEKIKGLRSEDQTLLEKLFGTIIGKQSIRLSALKNTFYTKIKDVQSATYQTLVNSKYLIDASNKLKSTMLTVGVLLGLGLPFLAFFFNALMDDTLLIALVANSIISTIIIISFALIMPKRTEEGAFLEHRIKGFRMYMETAEKYRSQFNEKENIFEKFLPYAIMFGMTKKWIDAMKNIYGEKYISSYHPVWFYGIGGSPFNFDDFANNIENMSAQMATTMASNPSSSGAGGGGFSGGGGGGGGGGGW